MTIKRMDIRNLHHLLKNEYRRHFPKEERKPYATIMQLVFQRRYEGYGMYDNGQLCGYALVMKHKGDVLLDYFAVQEDLRGRGVGTAFLNRLCDTFLQQGQVVFAEIEMEEPGDTADRAAEKKARQKFYTDNGWRATGASLTLFDVDYVIIEKSNTPCSDAQAKERVDGFYRTSIVSPVYKRKVFWHQIQDTE